MDAFSTVPITELINRDERPIFVVDLSTLPPTLVLFNLALQNQHALWLEIEAFWCSRLVTDEAAREDSPSVKRFKDWISAPSGNSEGAACCHSFGSVRWVAYLLQDRYRVISGDQILPHVTSSELDAKVLKTAVTAAQESRYIPSRLRLLWQHDMSATLATPFLQLFHTHDWSKTLLGPKEKWSYQLRRACELLLADPRQSSFMWGPEKVFVYNEAYADVLGPARHPRCLGLPLRFVWPEIYQAFDPYVDEMIRTGVSFATNDVEYVLNRHGYPESTYFSLGLIPIAGDDEAPAFLNPVYDTTKQVLAERRLSTLLSLTPTSTFGMKLKDAWAHIITTITKHTKDLPLAVLYSAAEISFYKNIDAHSERTSSISLSSRTSSGESSGSNWFLEGTVGFGDTTDHLPKVLSDEDARNFTPVFGAALSSLNPSTLLIDDRTLSPTLFKDIINDDLKDPCKSAALLPLRTGSGETVLGFLLIGINPRIPFNLDYQHFVQVFQQQIAAILTSSFAFEREQQRVQAKAEQSARTERRLNEKLATNMKETSNVMEKFERYWRLAEMSTVGMFDFSPDGKLIQANETWFRLSGHPRTTDSPRSFHFMDCIYPVDVELVREKWHALVAGNYTTFEMRWRKDPQITEWGEAGKDYVWVLAACVPVHDADGQLISVSGCTIDISTQKWAELEQSRKIEEALETKRQQENFIDMTSHEMRNPLSAMFQCADSVYVALSELLSKYSDHLPHAVKAVIEESVESVHTINACAMHQKRIIDDILTLSKLDSKLLSISPTQVNPVSFLQEISKIFGLESRREQVELHTIKDSSLSRLKIQELVLDPSRVHQVLINLVTNAMKFTRVESLRTITLFMGASLERREKTIFPGLEVTYNASQILQEDKFAVDRGWGDGEVVYLHFAVEDTGRGMTSKELGKLFSRFSQASSRTHVQYGGSGLGLFISRELVELQGGEIGVSSEFGRGSIFAFYVKTRRSIAGNLDQLTPEAKNAETVAVPLSFSILVVEDNVVNNKILCKQLGKLGHRVHGVGNGQEALDYLPETTFWHRQASTPKPLDLILMDIEMPVMNGLICTTEIRQLERKGLLTRHVPIIAVSANARSEQIADSLEVGMDAAIPKPFRITELTLKMVTLMRDQNQAQSQAQSQVCIVASEDRDFGFVTL